MPTLSKPYPVAIALSDLHLTLVPPACRDDKDWMDAQAQYLHQVKQLAPALPIICAGDIFDKWNASPELINFALEHLPDGMYCIPGQHDLPSHRMDLMHRSGYGVLVRAKKIKDISGKLFITPKDLALYGFGWEEEVEPVSEEEEDDPSNRKAFLHIAVIHRYIWTDDKKYPGAPDTSRLTAFSSLLRGYDVAVFGDNHKSFLSKSGSCTVFNCGGFIRKKTDEIQYSPNVGVIYNDGSVKPVKLNTSTDRFHPLAEDRKEVEFDMGQFIDQLQSLGEHGLDFQAAVKKYILSNPTHPRVKEIIASILDNV